MQGQERLIRGGTYTYLSDEATVPEDEELCNRCQSRKGAGNFDIPNP